MFILQKQNKEAEVQKMTDGHLQSSTTFFASM